jgi:Fur family transcriptional regulator, stress-responsive regulator
MVPSDDPRAILTAHGLRVTAQRRAILSAVVGAGNHLTADETLARARRELPELSRATVYNALGELLRAGALRTVPGPGAVRYERAGGERHDHFRCTSCGRLYDVHVHGHEALALVEDGYAVDRASIVLEGRCPACA